MTRHLFSAHPLYRFLAGDHERLDRLLQSAFSQPGLVDEPAYAAFRAGLLRHIAIEEKILLPTAQRLRNGKPLALAARLRLDHGALAAMLVSTPTVTIGRVLRVILTAHNALEEGPDGLYATCVELAADESDALLTRMRAAPAVLVSPYTDGPKVTAATARALMRAGYDAEAAALQRTTPLHRCESSS